MKNGFVIILPLICWLATTVGMAQSAVPPSRSGRARQWVLKAAPLSLLEFSSTVQLAAERVIASNQSIQVELGYGWQAINLWLRPDQSRFSQYEVWRGRAEWRQYWRGRQAPYGAYTAVEGFYKQENAFENGSVGVYAEQGQFQYYRLYALSITKQVFGVNVKLGRQFPLSANGRLVGDFYVGLGLRTRSIQQADRPQGYQLYNQSFIDITPFTEYGPLSIVGLPIGFNIGYTL